MRIVQVVCVALACIGVSLTAQNQSPANEVHQLYLDDQADRASSERQGKVQGRALSWDEINKRDSARRARVHELLESGQLKTAEDFHDAAFIYQHGQNPDDYLLAHVLAMVAVQKGDTKSIWISAATLDRYLQKSGQPQIFETQYGNQGNSPFTQEPYNRDLIPDQLRLVYCVPGIEQQKKNVAEFDAGKYPAGIIPPGCSW